jgi:dsRNA-specific ribonuclease
VDEIERLREEAWLGDAVLSLFVRDWLLATRSREFPSAERAALFELFTSNQFLSSFGEPTRVEAEIGRVYRSGGVPEAFTFIEAKFLKRFLTGAQKRGYHLEKPASIIDTG